MRGALPAGLQRVFRWCLPGAPLLRATGAHRGRPGVPDSTQGAIGAGARSLVMSAAAPARLPALCSCSGGGGRLAPPAAASAALAAAGGQWASHTTSARRWGPRAAAPIEAASPNSCSSSYRQRRPPRQCPVVAVAAPERQLQRQQQQHQEEEGPRYQQALPDARRQLRPHLLEHGWLHGIGGGGGGVGTVVGGGATANGGSGGATAGSADPAHSEQHRPQQHQGHQHQQHQHHQQRASQVLLLGVDPDSGGALAVVRADLVPHRPGGDGGGAQQQEQWEQQEQQREQQQQGQRLFVDLATAQVAVYDMPVELIPLRKLSKSGKQRFRRRLDVGGAISTVRGILGDVQRQQEEQDAAAGGGGGGGRVVLRAVLEVASILPTNGSLSTLNQGYSLGAWTAALLALGFEVSTVHALHWKRELGLLRRSKDSSRHLAAQLYAAAGNCQQALLRRKRDHGRAEALLIAAWGAGWALPANLLGGSRRVARGSDDDDAPLVLPLQGPLRETVEMDGGMHLLERSFSQPQQQQQQQGHGAGSLPAAAPGAVEPGEPPGDAAGEDADPAEAFAARQRQAQQRRQEQPPHGQHPLQGLLKRPRGKAVEAVQVTAPVGAAGEEGGRRRGGRRAGAVRLAAPEGAVAREAPLATPAVEAAGAVCVAAVAERCR